MNRVRVILEALILLLLSQLAYAAVPQGWNINGNNLSDYTIVTDRTVTYQGHPSVSITSKDSTGFGGLNQMTSANDYKGKRVRLSAYLRTRDVTGEGSRGAHVWLRIDGTDQKMLGFDNMDSRPVRGSTDWTKYEIVLDVPMESVALAYGFFMNATGTVWATEFKVEEVSDAVPTTSGLPRHPVNLSFDK